MVELDDLAGKVFALLKGYGLKIKIFDDIGAETTNPNDGRRFFVTSPNLMVTIDEDNNEIGFSKGPDEDESVLALQKNIRKLADEFLMNSDIKVFGKQIQPRDYAYQAKMKGATMNEALDVLELDDRVVATVGRFDVISGTVVGIKSNEVVIKANNGKTYSVDRSQCKKVQRKTSNEAADMTPHNHHLVGQIIKMVKVFGGTISEADLTSNLGVTDLSDIRPVLNKLVTDGKLKAEHDKHGHAVYAIAMDEAITESFSKMFGSLKTSQQTLENVRILVKHKVPVDENVRGARARHISAIFLECNGERFRFPHNYLPGARAMAQHMAHGGVMGDKVGSYISESTGNLLKLQSFNRYVTTNNLINEDSSGIVDTVKENIETIRTELKKLTGTKTYETVKARLETFEREALSEDDTSTLKDLFTIRRFDEKFEGVLPIIKQMVQEKDTFHKRIEESAANVVMLRRESINTTPMFEFASENARLGFKLNELSLRILENEELAGFVNKIGTKLCKEGTVNDFEKAILTQVLENIQIAEKQSVAKEIKESVDLSAFYDRYTQNFY